MPLAQLAGQPCRRHLVGTAAINDDLLVRPVLAEDVVQLALVGEFRTGDDIRIQPAIALCPDVEDHRLPARFDERMQKLATHIRQAGEDVAEVQTSSRKITAHFQKIEAAQLDELPVGLPGEG